MALSHQEKAMMIGKLIHIVQSSEGGFKTAQVIIEAGESAGLLNGVEIMPESKEEIEVGFS